MNDAIRDPAATLADAIAAADRQLDAPAAVLATGAPERGGAVVPDERFVLFSIASTHYAVPETFVTEVESVPVITLVPRTPAWLRGVTNLRGDILSVVDMRTFLGLDATSPHGRRMLVVRLLDDAFSAGFLVDAVERIATVPPNEITPPASSFDTPGRRR